MSLVASWGQIGRAIGGEAGQLWADVAEVNGFARGALNVTCNIANAHPGNYENLNSLTRSFVDNACKQDGQEGFQQIQQPPFEGGQCEGVQYRIDLVASRTTQGGDPIFRQATHTTFGPIAIIDIRRPTGFNDPRIIGWFIQSRNENGTERIFTIPIGGEFNEAQQENISISRVDGELDNCGNLDGDGFPPPDDIPESDRSFTVNLHEDNQTFIQENNPEGDTINFFGDTHTVTINQEGVNIVNNNDLPDPDNEPPPPTEPPECVVLCEPPPTVAPEIDVQLEFEVVEREEDDEEKEEEEMDAKEFGYVLVQVTTAPEKRKTILQRNPDNNTFFAGWFRWRVEIDGTTYGFPELPINKPSQIFRRPDDASSFSLYTTNFAKVKTSVLRRIIPPDEEE